MTNTKYNGLTSTEVKELQEKYGPNAINEKFDSSLTRFLKKFVGPIQLMIEVALILSLISGKWEDFTIIALLLVVNIGVDFAQEQKAHKALSALKDTLAPVASVIRDSVLKDIPARELVPGDIIKLSIGDIVPADAKIIDTTSTLSVDQSQITGESLPVEKEDNDDVFSSSIIQRGEAYAEVTATGALSSIGKNASLVARAEREGESHFQKAILTIGRFLVIFASVLILIVATILILRGDSIMETVRFATVL